MTEAERLADAIDPLKRKSLDNLTCAVAAALIRSQAAEVDALRADAERYVALITMSPREEICFLGECYFGKAALDAAIDAARQS